MFYEKLFRISGELNLPIHNEFIFISFNLQESYIKIEYLENSSFKHTQTKDSNLIKVLDEVYNYAVSKGFDSYKEDCTISLEGRKLLVFPNPTDFYESLDEEEVEDFFDGNLNFNDKKFLVEELWVFINGKFRPIEESLTLSN